MSALLKARADALGALDGAEIDLLVLGGGITGAGVVREAAYRGLRTLLAERRDYAAGTSSRSSKLVHGGLRYLEHGALGLVFEATNERLALSRIAPHLVRPLPFLYPVYEGQRPGLLTMEIGMAIYDALSLFGAPGLHRPLGSRRLSSLAPDLRADGLRGGIRYFDARTDDARLTLETILDARLAGASCFNGLEVTALSSREGRVHGAELSCAVSGRAIEVRPRCVVFATGPWTDRVRQRLGLPVGATPLVRGTRGAHIVVDAPRTGGNHAIVLRSRNDDRVMFRIPWGARAIIGTTDLDYSGDPAEVHATTEEVDYLLATTNDHFPGAKLTRDDVISTYAGVRPLVHEDEGSPSEVSREHQVLCGGDGTVTVVGGKLTTYRSMAEEIVDRVVEVLGARGGTVDGRALRIPAHGLLQRARERWEELADGEVLTRRGTTARRVLPGAIGVAHRDGPARVQRDLERAFGDRAVAQHLLLRYGGRAYGVAAMAEEDPELARRISADTPSIWAEVPFAARHDLALTLEDVLDRRTSVLLTDRAQGLEAADRAAELLAPLLGWDDAARRREVAAYGRAVARTRRWKDDQKGSSASGPSSANGTSSSGGADSSEDAPAGASGAS